MRDVEFFLASPLEKVFPNARPTPLKTEMYAWRGTRAAVQLVYYAPKGRDGSLVQTFALSVEGAPVPAELYAVELLPSDFPCWENAVTDANYLTHEPGLFPDLLRPLEDKRIRPVPRQYRSVWLSFDIPADAAPGVYEVTVTAVPDRELLMGSGAVWKDPEVGPQECRMAFRLHVGMAELAAQTLIHTEWFYADCLASYYHVPVFSEEHWHILDCFMEEAARRHGVNMLLTPVFTPPLDTAVGTRRPTVQLVGITVENGAYSLPFWRRSCRRCAASWRPRATAGSMCTSTFLTSRLRSIWKATWRRSIRWKICWRAARWWMRSAALNFIAGAWWRTRFRPMTTYSRLSTRRCRICGHITAVRRA